MPIILIFFSFLFFLFTLLNTYWMPKNTKIKLKKKRKEYGYEKWRFGQWNPTVKIGVNIAFITYQDNQQFDLIVQFFKKYIYFLGYMIWYDRMFSTHYVLFDFRINIFFFILKIQQLSVVLHVDKWVCMFVCDVFFFLLWIHFLYFIWLFCMFFILFFLNVVAVKYQNKITCNNDCTLFHL